MIVFAMVIKLREEFAVLREMHSPFEVFFLRSVMLILDVSYIVIG